MTTEVNRSVMMTEEAKSATAEHNYGAFFTRNCRSCRSSSDWSALKGNLEFRTFNRIHATMTKEETPEETHNYGAFFTSPTVKAQCGVSANAR